MVLRDVVEVVDGLVGVVLRAGGESFDLLFADAAKFRVLANFWALSDALVISPDRPMNASMALPATLCAMPVMTPSFAPKAAGEAVAGFDAGGVAGGFRCAAERRFDGLADALHAGHDLYERGGDLDCHAMPP